MNYYPFFVEVYMKKGIVFYGLVNFWNNKDKILEEFSKMTIDEIEIYKMFVYSLPFMEDNIKDLIWEYLNGYEESKFILGREYSKAKTKLDKRKREYIEVNDDVIY